MALLPGEDMAGTTGLEPATSDVTGRRSNQLSYVPLSADVLRHSSTQCLDCAIARMVQPSKMNLK